MTEASISEVEGYKKKLEVAGVAIVACFAIGMVWLSDAIPSVQAILVALSLVLVRKMPDVVRNGMELICVDTPQCAQTPKQIAGPEELHPDSDVNTPESEHLQLLEDLRIAYRANPSQKDRECIERLIMMIHTSLWFMQYERNMELSSASSSTGVA